MTKDHLYVRFGVPESLAITLAGWLLGTLLWALASQESPFLAWRLPRFWLFFFAVTAAATALCSLIPQARLSRDGLLALDTFCLPRRVAWSDVTAAREFTLAGLRWLWIYHRGGRYPLWVPFFRSGRGEIIAFLQQVESHPVDMLLRGRLPPTDGTVASG